MTRARHRSRMSYTSRSNVEPEAEDTQDTFACGGRTKRKHRDIKAHGHASRARADKRARGGGMKNPFSSAHRAFAAGGHVRHYDDGGSDDSQPHSAAADLAKQDPNSDPTVPNATIPEDLPSPLRKFMSHENAPWYEAEQPADLNGPGEGPTGKIEDPTTIHHNHATAEDLLQGFGIAPSGSSSAPPPSPSDDLGPNPMHRGGTVNLHFHTHVHEGEKHVHLHTHHGGE